MPSLSYRYPHFPPYVTFFERTARFLELTAKYGRMIAVGITAGGVRYGLSIQATRRHLHTNVCRRSREICGRSRGGSDFSEECRWYKVAPFVREYKLVAGCARG